MGIIRVALICVIGGGVLYLGIDQNSLYIFLSLMCMDFLLGLLSAYTQKKVITFRKAMIGIIQKITQLFIPVVASLILKATQVDQETANSFLATIMSMLISFEGISVLGHIYRIHTGKELQTDEYSVEKVIEKIFNLI